MVYNVMETAETSDDDIHNYRLRLRIALKCIEREPMANQDKELLKAYVDHMTAQGIGFGRMAKVAFSLLVLSRHLSVTFRKAGRKEIEKLISWVNTSDHTAYVKSDFKNVLKKFYKFVRYGNTDKVNPYPPEVSWIVTAVKKCEVREPEILTTEQVKLLMAAANNMRDKAFIGTASEAGPRPGEWLRVKIGDIVFDRHGALVYVRKGKTGGRPIRLLVSAPLLTQYLEGHPLRNDPSAPLWISMGVRSRNSRLSYYALRKMLMVTAEKAGLRIRIHAHMFRHTAATRDASYLTEQQLKIKYGWGPASKQAATYVHLSHRDVDNAIIEAYTGKAVVRAAPEFSLVECLRCHADNTPGMKYCGRCGMPLERSDIATAGVEEESLRREMAEMRALLERAISQPSQGAP